MLVAPLKVSRSLAAVSFPFHFCVLLSLSPFRFRFHFPFRSHFGSTSTFALASFSLLASSQIACSPPECLQLYTSPVTVTCSLERACVSYLTLTLTLPPPPPLHLAAIQQPPPPPWPFSDSVPFSLRNKPAAGSRLAPLSCSLHDQ